jgi:hypothetical protein
MTSKVISRKIGSRVSGTGERSSKDQAVFSIKTRGGKIEVIWMRLKSFKS